MRNREDEVIGSQDLSFSQMDESGEGDLQALASALHALSQPVTALMCRLELGSMSGTIDGYREALAESLRECSRLVRSVGVMRELITRALERQ